MVHENISINETILSRSNNFNIINLFINYAVQKWEEWEMKWMKIKINIIMWAVCYAKYCNWSCVDLYSLYVVM